MVRLVIWHKTPKTSYQRWAVIYFTFYHHRKLIMFLRLEFLSKIPNIYRFFNPWLYYINTFKNPRTRSQVMKHLSCGLIVDWSVGGWMLYEQAGIGCWYICIAKFSWGPTFNFGKYVSIRRTYPSKKDELKVVLLAISPAERETLSALPLTVLYIANFSITILQQRQPPTSMQNLIYIYQYYNTKQIFYVECK